MGRLNNSRLETRTHVTPRQSVTANPRPVS
jgi:hypothetical protein